MHRGMLITGLLAGVAKRESRNYLKETHSRLLAVCEEYDRKHYETAPCSRDILCQREGVRHRSGCPESPAWLGGELQW